MTRSRRFAGSTPAQGPEPPHSACHPDGAGERGAPSRLRLLAQHHAGLGLIAMLLPTRHHGRILAVGIGGRVDRPEQDSGTSCVNCVVDLNELAARERAHGMRGNGIWTDRRAGMGRESRPLFQRCVGGGVNLLDRSGNISTVVPKRRGVGGMAMHGEDSLVMGGRDIAVVRLADGKTSPILALSHLPGAQASTT